MPRRNSKGREPKRRTTPIRLPDPPPDFVPQDELPESQPLTNPDPESPNLGSRYAPGSWREALENSKVVQPR